MISWTYNSRLDHCPMWSLPGYGLQASVANIQWWGRDSWVWSSRTGGTYWSKYQWSAIPDTYWAAVGDDKTYCMYICCSKFMHVHIISFTFDLMLLQWMVKWNQGSEWCRGEEKELKSEKKVLYYNSCQTLNAEKNTYISGRITTYNNLHLNDEFWQEWKTSYWILKVRLH